eukprot:CAMPEP_0183296108 /NCGR_PEP_ID=MMETSP0160_2-20130417/3806_1 /TAXON_ID=2839 ORGANISM="Odontella Sinensis, Strain Grunow 1884" /NCGR_SAMPLE_ID=MMETSP0160_2 /ASSEMBLY_ACC=CAM_ASM_000250 /LENGTH=456 /DNA_ID=CAMNT_0025457687 /DNA_START=44 /DNA_END=1414 /DNA_ORIENTATION=+
MRKIGLLRLQAILLSLRCASAFVSPQSRATARAPTASLGMTSSSSSDDPDEAERRRMEMVRSLQKTFYKDSGDDETVKRPTLQTDTGVVTDLPLWRVGWVETPGRANCLNVHEGQYTHMFETILSGPKPWYVGHLHLPGGFKMARTDEERYDLKTWEDELDDDERFEGTERSAVMGALMRIADYRRTEDGRLVLLVHPVERFVVSRIGQHFPYSVADVQILPDTDQLPDGADENFCKIARAAAVARSFRYHDYEYKDIELPLPKDVEYLPAEGIPASALSKILPFAYYSTDDSSLDKIEETQPASSSSASFAGGQPPLERRLQNGGILANPPFLAGPETANRRTANADALETLLWLALDDFCRCTGFVLPEGILCLMPPELDYLDMEPPQRRLSPKYPPLRRQQRLSYLAPALLENINIGAGMRQTWLNTPSTRTRLAAVLERYELINSNMMGQYQ